jgi:hypothetical protein
MPRRSTVIFLGVEFSSPDGLDFSSRKGGGKGAVHNSIRHALPESKNSGKLNPGRRTT